MNSLTMQVALTGVIIALCLHDIIFKPKQYSKFLWIAMSVMQVAVHYQKESYLFMGFWVLLTIMWIALLMFDRKLDRKLKEVKEELESLTTFIEEANRLMEEHKRREEGK